MERICNAIFIGIILACVVTLITVKPTVKDNRKAMNDFICQEAVKKGVK